MANSGEILIVEDSRLQAETLAQILLQEGYTVKTAPDGLEGLSMFAQSQPNLVISDVWMPKMNGYELCRALKNDKTAKSIPIILLTSVSKFENILNGLNAGADYYLTKPYSKSLLLSMVKSIFSKLEVNHGGGNGHVLDELVPGISLSSRQILNFLYSTYENVLYQNETLAQTKQELVRLNSRLEERVKEKTESIKKTLNGIVIALSTAVEIRDPYTAGHQSRVAQLAGAIGRQLGLCEEHCEGIRVTGLLHDIGKIIVPAEILCKPSRLTEYELHFIKAHPQAGYDILKGIEFPWPIATAVIQHHERINGSGYPSGLTGREIIIEAKILAVADVIESMASHRPYRPSRGIEPALEEISRNKGALYAAEVVDASLRLFREKGFKFE